MVVTDTLSGTSDTKTCNMYSAALQAKVLDIKLLTETNKNGYIDFNANLAAFKVYIMNSEFINEQSI